jgi:hypothetical protein
MMKFSRDKRYAAYLYLDIPVGLFYDNEPMRFVSLLTVTGEIIS